MFRVRVGESSNIGNVVTGGVIHASWDVLNLIHVVWKTLDGFSYVPKLVGSYQQTDVLQS